MSDFPIPSVSLVNNLPCTTSLAIASHFDKRHDHVIRDIRDLIAACPPEFSVPNFGAVEYTDEQGKPRLMFHVFFDGFILLVMGYTGKKALQMKLAYIEAFNAMREKLEEEKRAQLLTLPPAPITPEQLVTLHAIIDGLARKDGKMNGDEIRREHLRIWNRFRTHFNIAKYAELPMTKMDEAVAFLMKMDKTEEIGAIPGGLMTVCPFTDREKEQARKELAKLISQLVKVWQQIRDGLRPGLANMKIFEDNRKFFDMRMRIAFMASREVYAARQALELAMDMLKD